MTDQEFLTAKEQWTPLMNRISGRWKFTFSLQDRNQIADIALWKAMKKFDGGKSTFKTYLYNFLEWEFSTSWRKEKSKIKTISLEGLCKSPEKFGISNFPIVQMSFVEKDCLVEHDMADEIQRRLTGSNRAVFTLFREGKTPNQVSAILNMSRQRVDQIFGRVRKSFFISKVRENNAE